MLRLATLLACALLAGCAALPPPPVAREAVGDFMLEARFALRVSPPDRPAESSGGRLEWEHRNGNDRILIANPLGVGIAEIDSAPAHARLRTGDGQEREASDPDTLLASVTGQALPVRRLPDWLLGRGDERGIERDAAGRPARLNEAGWQVDYSYPDDAPGALPERVTLRQDGTLELRLRIETWKTAP